MLLCRATTTRLCFTAMRYMHRARKPCSAFGRNAQKTETVFRILVHFWVQSEISSASQIPPDILRVAWRWRGDAKGGCCIRLTVDVKGQISRHPKSLRAPGLCAVGQNPTGWVRISTPAHRAASRRLSPLALRVSPECERWRGNALSKC